MGRMGTDLVFTADDARYVKMLRQQFNKVELKDGASESVYCLVLDMIRGTDFSLSMSQAKSGRFGYAMVEQIKARWSMPDFSKLILKFQGDGWIVFTNDARLVSELCFFGLSMVRNFQEDMSKLLELAPSTIPQLRAAVSFGTDVRIALPNGQHDWAGDSARRATRAAGYSDGQTLLVSETIKQIVGRDFVCHPFDLESAVTKPKRVEEPESLFVVVGPQNRDDGG
jgi:class 3 adenylate cyclase